MRKKIRMCYIYVPNHYVPLTCTNKKFFEFTLWILLENIKGGNIAVYESSLILLSGSEKVITRKTNDKTTSPWIKMQKSYRKC